MEIYVIKTRNLNGTGEDALCAYDNANSAYEHIESYQKIYANQLDTIMWCDIMTLKSEFKIE